MTRDPEAQAADQGASRIAVGVAFLLTLAFFWPTVASLPGTWAQSGMSHGWLVAGLGGWIVWRDRALLRRGGGGVPMAILPLGILSLLWFAAVVAHIRLFHQMTLLVILVFWGFAVFGSKGCRTILAVGTTLFLALPFWGALVPILRSMTTLASGAMVRVLGIGPEIEGDVIHIAAGSFLIEDGCAGLRFLVAGLVVGVFYAHILVASPRVQLAVVSLAGAISILVNWIRVAILIVIGHVTDMQSVLMERHIGFGWVVFTFGLVPFFLLARIVERRFASASGRSLTKHTSGERGLEAGVSDVPGEGENRVGLRHPREEAGGMMQRAVMTTAIALVGPLLYYGIGALPAANLDELTLTDLARGDQWRVSESPAIRPFGWRPEYHGAGQHDSLNFTDGTAHVYGDRIVYRKQAQGAKLVGYPNRIAPDSDVLDERLMGPLELHGSLWVRQVVVMTATGPILVWYWYRVGGVDTFSPIHAKVLEIPAFVSRRRVSELIAFSAACEPDNCREAFEALARFLGAQETNSS